jgi:dGTPase
MREHGGFEHNGQSLRVVELLETPYPKFAGLNLTFEVREGIQKHQALYDPPDRHGEKYPSPTLEAQASNLADEITYYSHDLDDAIDFDILSFGQLEDIRVWRCGADSVRKRYPDLREPELHKLVIREIIDRQVEDVVSNSAVAIASAEVRSSDEVRTQLTPLVRYSDELWRDNGELRKFLYQNVYYHPRVAQVNRRACEMLGEVFAAYVRDPERLGDGATRRIEQEGLHRTVCDYVAGMTDRYLIEEFQRLNESLQNR